MNSYHIRITVRRRLACCLLSLNTFLLIFLMGLSSSITAQDSKQMVRIAKVTVDSLHVRSYYEALKEQMTTAIATEPGVLTYYAVADKKDSSQITILEIYADSLAYTKHIETTHFKRYKDRVKDMVKHLELVDVRMIAVAKKPD